MRIILVLLLLVLAWRVLSLGMADALSRSNQEQALSWRPRHSSALFLLAEQQVKNPELRDEAKKNALAALRAYPYEGRAYRVLGQLADNEKNPELAFKLYQKALHYSPRDLESHLWLMNYSLRTGNAEDAVLHLDRLLRLQLELLPQLIPTIGGLAVEPQSQAIV
ncbi:MAG: tetratricopeptide repeat protein, partial [Arenimonas sp.]